MPKSASTVPPPFGKPTLPWQFEHLQTMIPQNVSETSMCLVSKMASWFTSWSLSRRYTFRISQPTVTALSFSPLLRWIREGPCDQREGHLRMSGSPWALSLEGAGAQQVVYWEIPRQLGKIVERLGWGILMFFPCWAMFDHQRVSWMTSIFLFVIICE